MLKIDPESKLYKEIAALIERSESPVGIDAKKTHVLILEKLIAIEERLQKLEKAVKDRSV